MVVEVEVGLEEVDAVVVKVVGIVSEVVVVVVIVFI